MLGKECWWYCDHCLHRCPPAKTQNKQIHSKSKSECSAGQLFNWLESSRVQWTCTKSDPICAKCCSSNCWSPHPKINQSKDGELIFQRYQLMLWLFLSFQKTSWAHLTELLFSFTILFSPTLESFGNCWFLLCTSLQCPPFFAVCFLFETLVQVDFFYTTDPFWPTPLNTTPLRLQVNC